MTDTTSAAYPANYFSTPNRTNGETVWAADVNELQWEMAATQNVLGTNPNWETQIPGATRVDYSNVSERISDAMTGRGHPYLAAKIGPFKVSRSSSGWGMVADPTHPVSNSPTPGILSTPPSDYPQFWNTKGQLVLHISGVWVIEVAANWEYASSGIVSTALNLGGVQWRRDVYDYSQWTDSHGSSGYGQTAYTFCHLTARCGAGTVVTTSSGNYTNINPITVSQSDLVAYWLRP